MKKEDVVVEKALLSNNYFRLFKLQEKLDIDLNELENQYIKLIKYTICEQQSQNIVQINIAYQVLKSPLKRAEHLLEILNIQITQDYCNDPTILNEAITIRENILEYNDFKSARIMIDTKLQECLQKFSQAYDIRDFEISIKQIIRLKYLSKIYAEVKEQENAIYANV
ncbi:iron-sulfur cluster co-chaperone HscB C-terminal domain-containing protein [Wolbachia endosymbiont of Howardula sp.]|uniref:iron-sulfur cluster co-chaperone HscB C-terminal domain-containing protein n=1 Tax=Wolbachia endosymbiont of Howardula sp. TaxID=2916816 RepID=UPI00217E16E8|nr:iron-sulfur cluster co-chaperone HscB C-terminal domain-containing protein [Wolbachia endosymbiont of Howardula sp.]UWI83340.1 molecular chaperone Hsc20 [Wolbachia endosymbiont of Howardula sp.]